MRPRPPPTPLAACILAALGAASWAACATAETPAFSHADCVAGGCQQASGSSSSSSSGTCTPDPACTVSWGKDIFTGIIDGPAGCTSMTCHGGGMGGITLTSGQSNAAYAVLTGYTLLGTPGPAKKYIVPCDPMGSGFPCNMTLATGAGTNPYGTCGFLMPSGAGATTLTMAQLTQIGDWIQCGAPDN